MRKRCQIGRDPRKKHGPIARDRQRCAATPANPRANVVNATATTASDGAGGPVTQDTVTGQEMTNGCGNDSTPGITGSTA